ncbi:helix-turn-helix domain-containing protein [Paenibacillus cremeus]|uniref:Helix-turn-helix domain-containing protein n=1 Tax=Paenibacillus cremeus TaxID=2163881 RepID=A0A559K6L3_9BACL|nr:helix-turn-helix domain-containing protein [Paenibacillus cremeus]TVY07769.1 helix-turn-helix domain-containing protein [Paenibacillus cremeus]
MLANIFPHKKYSGTLFYRLLISFLIIILLLVSFNVMTFTFFRSNIRDEIIKNSSLNLNATVVNYEKHIKLIKSMMIGNYFNNKTEILKNDSLPFDYYIASEIQKDLQNTLTNSQLFLYNVIYYFPRQNYALDKSGASPTETMFNKFFQSTQYTKQFWEQELQKPFSFHIYPATDFIEKNSFYTNYLGRFNPIVFKSAANPNFAIIGMLDSAKMYTTFSLVQKDTSFYIYDESGKEAFSATNLNHPVQVRAGTEKSGHYVSGTDYYFYQKGLETGFTYLTVVPFDAISTQIVRLNVIMAVLLIVSILIGVVVSIFFAGKFHNPLSAIIRSIQEMDKNKSPALSTIQEFNVISQKLHDLFRTNVDIHNDLLAKNSLLQHYAYMNKVKMIHTDIQDAKLSMAIDRPFQLILYQVMYKESLLSEMGMDPNRASYYIKEFIHSLFTQTYKDSLTFQIEKDQILTIVFVETVDTSTTKELLHKVRGILELDAGYCDVTIAVSPVNANAMEFNAMFEQVGQLQKCRKLGEGVQIIYDKTELPPEIWFSQSDLKELTANLSSGNETITIPLVMKTLEHAVKRDASLFQINSLSKEIVNLIIKTMYSINIPISWLDDKPSPADSLKDCRTLEQFQSYFREFLTQSASVIKQKKEATDHITSFVTTYVNEHFGSDLSLDVLADKLNITGAYLSTYFKEKTDINFSEYVNSVRMDKATEMLQKTDLKIQDVAQLVGYYTVASFNRMFKKHTGLTPSEYRRMHLG